MKSKKNDGWFWILGGLWGSGMYNKEAISIALVTSSENPKHEERAKLPRDRTFFQKAVVERMH